LYQVEIKPKLRHEADMLPSFCRAIILMATSDFADPAGPFRHPGPVSDDGRVAADGPVEDWWELPLCTAEGSPGRPFGPDARSGSADAQRNRSDALLLLSLNRLLKVRRELIERRLEHDPEKWNPVFRKDHAPAGR
jgi:hypothetical protein